MTNFLCRIDLSKKLFYANEILQGCILQLRQLIEQNENISLLRIDPGVTYSLDEFVESQLLQIDSSHHQLRYFHDAVVDIVVKTCMVCGVKCMNTFFTELFSFYSTLLQMKAFATLKRVRGHLVAVNNI